MIGSALQSALRAAKDGTGPLPDGYRWKRPNRKKYGDLQRLRATRGVGRPPVERKITLMSTDLVQL